MPNTFSHGDSDYLSDAQLAQLLKAINGLRVAKDPKGNSHVEAYEIRAHLNRIFGIGRWSADVLEQHLVYETATEADKPRWSVCWYARLRLEIRSSSGKALCSYTEGATGDATNQPSRADANDQACKTAASQALKRCAMNLGDQFGLGLYNKGSLRPLVQRTLVWEPTQEMAAAESPAGPDAHITSPLAPEDGSGGGESQREVTSPPASRAPVSAAPAAAHGGGPAPVEQAPAVEMSPGAFMEVQAEPAEEEHRVHLGDDAAGPTAPDADGGSPAVSGESASSPSPVAEACESCGSTDGLHEEFCYAVINEGAPERTPGATVDAIAAMHPAEAVDPTGAGAADSLGEHTASRSSATSEAADPTTPPATPAAGDASSPNASPTESAESTDAASAAADPTPGNGSEPTAEPSGIEDPIDAWEYITGALNVIRMSPPEAALGILNGCMELAAQHRLATRRFGEGDKALSVVLTETMRDARAAIERRKAAAAGAS